MSDDRKDVLIAAYLFEDLAKRDFDAVLKLAEDKAITVEGVVVVQKDADGEVSVIETGDHLGRKGAKVAGGAGFVVGLFAPPVPAAPRPGAAGGGCNGKVRQAPTRERDRREDGRRAAPELGRRDRRVRLPGCRHDRQGARQRRPKGRRARRRRQRHGAKARLGRSQSRYGGRLSPAAMVRLRSWRRRGV